MKYCKSCGAALLDGFRFCVQCGATVGTDEPAAAAQGEPIPHAASAAVPVSGPAAEPTAAAISESAAPVEPAADPVPAPVQTDSVSGLPELKPEYSAPAAAQNAAPPSQAAATPVREPVPQPVRPAAPVQAEDAPAEKTGLLVFDGAFVALLLFCLPGVGLITAIIWALGGAKNPSRKNLARAYLLLILALCLFVGCIALLMYLIAGDQVRAFFSYIEAYWEGLPMLPR